ncbi:uncharacterized protein VTP21DRAFT_2783 [Calcarisporiella thermophila]|uniref:uncharacterized protein n=1 Tax=Calcarisporiella thermophila TaxID=911321 RepID=UPI003743DFE9
MKRGYQDHTDEPSRTLDQAPQFRLVIRQQPRQARLCSFREKVDRRPIDPPPIVQLLVRDESNKDYLQQSPYLFLHVSLMHPTVDREISFVNGTRVTAGATAQSLFKYKDTDGSEGGFFIFPDISVRSEGRFRLKFVLYEILR